MALEAPPLFSSKFIQKARKSKKAAAGLDGGTDAKLIEDRLLAAGPGTVGKGRGGKKRKAGGADDTDKAKAGRREIPSSGSHKWASGGATLTARRVQGVGFKGERGGDEEDGFREGGVLRGGEEARRGVCGADVDESGRTHGDVRGSEEGGDVSRDGMQAGEPMGEKGRGGRRKRMGGGKRGKAGGDGEVDGEREEGEEDGEDGEEGGGEDEGEVEEEGEEEKDDRSEGDEEEEEEGREEKEEDGGTEEDDGAAAALLAKADVSLTAIATCDSFADLALAPWLVATCHEMGLRHPTPVQCACIPPVVAGSNVIGVAQTGSGKTAAFALPILQKLAEDPYGVFALVLTPTRELALQIADQFRALGSSLSLRCAIAIGGGDMVEQAMQLASRPHVVVATPGRLREMLQQEESMGRIFSNLQFLVLDEADRLLDRGFEEEIGAILARMPKERQTLLFSATFTANLHALKAMSKTKKLFHFEAYEGFKTVEALDQSYLFLPSNVRDVYLCRLLSRLLPSLSTILPPAPPPSSSAAARPPVRSVIVFTSSCQSCQAVSALLDEVGLSNAPLHALLPQRKRSAALHRFKASQVPILVATDVASRGLDIPTVDLVINYDIPRFTRDYVHRVGRTARAGRGGRAISLVTQYDVHLVHSIEKLIGRQLAECTDVTEGDVLKCISKVFKARRAALLKVSESGFEERAKQRADQKRKIREERREREGGDKGEKGK
ncbi:unnamed protein product [Closterium sp. NIES-53]